MAWMFSRSMLVASLRIVIAIAARSLALGVGLAAVVACETTETPPTDMPQADGSAPASDGGGGGPVDAAVACTELDPNANTSGFHAAGYDFQFGNGCAFGQCHNGSSSPRWTISGAVFTQQTGGQPVRGATVYITDSTGRGTELVTASNGAFWTQEVLSPPYTTYVSGCPSTLEMVATATGNCNAGGTCHNGDNRIYLPLDSPAP